MEVKLRGLGNVLSEACADDLAAAVAFAAERLGRGVARALERRSHKKRRPGVSMAGPRESAENGKRPNKRNGRTSRRTCGSVNRRRSKNLNGGNKCLFSVAKPERKSQ